MPEKELDHGIIQAVLDIALRTFQEAIQELATIPTTSITRPTLGKFAFSISCDIAYPGSGKGAIS